MRRRRLERSDVKRQGLVEQPERRIDIFPLPPRQDGLQEPRRLALGRLTADFMPTLLSLPAALQRQLMRAPVVLSRWPTLGSAVSSKSRPRCSFPTRLWNF